jgi:hypothetical protein
MVNPKSIANLKPVTKGHSGNKNNKYPNGYLTPLIKRFLNKKIDITDPETQKKVKALVKDAVIWRLIFNATQGENEAIKEILNRIDGKVIEKTELTGKDGANLIPTTYTWKTNE